MKKCIHIHTSTYIHISSYIHIFRKTICIHIHFLKIYMKKMQRASATAAAAAATTPASTGFSACRHG